MLPKINRVFQQKWFLCFFVGVLFLGSSGGGWGGEEVDGHR